MHSSRPLRVGLLSSSGDKPELIPRKTWFPILGTTVNKFVSCYAHKMPEIREYNFRISYRNIEYKNIIDEIDHPFIRECLKDSYRGIKSLNLSCLSTLPSGLGMGSSGAFAVAFTDLISRLENNEVLSNYNLFTKAYKIEKIISSEIGFQDHLHAAFGGLNLYEIRFLNDTDLEFFRPEIKIRPIRISKDSINKINNSFAILYDDTYSEEFRGEKKLGTNLRKDIWSITELDKKYEAIYDLIESLESEKINFLKIGKIISQDSESKKKYKGFENIYQKINRLLDLELIYGARPIGSKGSRFALIVSDKEKLLEINKKGFKTIPLELYFKNINK